MTTTLVRKVNGMTIGAQEDWEHAQQLWSTAFERDAEGRSRDALRGWDLFLYNGAIVEPVLSARRYAPLAPVFDRSIAQESETYGAAPVLLSNYVGRLNLGNIFECLGLPLAPRTQEIMRAWAPRIEVDRDEDPTHVYWSLAFAALAMGDRMTYLRLGGFRGANRAVPDPSHAGPPLGPFPLIPHQRFGFNQQGFLHHLAGAIERGGTFEDIAPAWEEYLINFPTLSQSRSVHLNTLLWVARCVFHRIAGHPLGETAARLHDAIWRLAGLEP